MATMKKKKHSQARWIDFGSESAQAFFSVLMAWLDNSA